MVLSVVLSPTLISVFVTQGIPLPGPTQGKYNVYNYNIATNVFGGWVLFTTDTMLFVCVCLRTDKPQFGHIHGGYMELV